MRRYFITGTDTDCGKTYVTARLSGYFSNSVAIKPIATGCFKRDNEWVSGDALELQKNSGLSLDLINPWRFKSAIAPHIAAKEEGTVLSAREIADYCLNIEAQGVERLFIEGAGGLMVPLNDNETWIDFLKMTGFPVILVVGMKLGCINHALLTELALATHNIKCIGWIANCLDLEMQALESNIKTLESFLKTPLLTILPFGGEIGAFNADLF